MTRFRLLAILVGTVLVALTAANASDPFRYPEAKHGKGELKYINSLPVLVVQGTPEEIGEQVGILGLKPIPSVRQLVEEGLQTLGLKKAYPFLIKAGNGLLPRFPADHRKELEAMAKASGYERDLLVFVNTFGDIAKFAGCSTLVLPPERSATGGPLFGRNFDLPPIEPLAQYGIVIVYRPEGKHAFASVIFPVAVGTGTAINDAGLSLAANEITSSKDGSPRFDPQGAPMLTTFRRIMEECTTVEEAEKLLRSVKRTTMISLTVCDKQGGAVFEITPKNIVVRHPQEGLCACTNHFRSNELATSTECSRYPLLEKTRSVNKLGVSDVAAAMHAVNQGPMTMQTMVFEPAALRLHLALGKGPASALPLKTLDLAPLLAGNGRTR